VALYDPATIGAPDNQLLLNTPGGVFFRAIGRKATFSDIREFNTLIPSAGGVEDYRTLLGAVNWVLQGKMYPNTQYDYEQGIRNLRAVADLDLEQVDVYDPDGYVPYIWSETDQDKQLLVKILYADFTETTKLTMPFTLYCTIKTPRLYGTTLRTAGTGNSAGILTGGVGFPSGFPFPFGATTYAIGATASNAGDRGAEPNNIVITGPIVNPIFTNTTTGEYIQVNVTMNIGDTLIIIYDSDNVSIELNGNSVYGSLNTDSTLFLVKPGANTFSLTGTSMGAGASGTITFLDTWSLA
jgi:hypothetical protein